MDFNFNFLPSNVKPMTDSVDQNPSLTDQTDCAVRIHIKVARKPLRRRQIGVNLIDRARNCQVWIITDRGVRFQTRALPFLEAVKGLFLLTMHFGNRERMMLNRKGMIEHRDRTYSWFFEREPLKEWNFYLIHEKIYCRTSRSLVWLNRVQPTVRIDKGE